MRKPMMVAAVCIAMASASIGQQKPQQNTTNPRPNQNLPSQMPDVSGSSNNEDFGGARERMQEQAAKNRNNERQKRLETDTAKLLSLATELKSEVDKSTKDTLSIQVINKAGEIERLAHDVKERMKG